MRSAARRFSICWDGRELVWRLKSSLVGCFCQPVGCEGLVRLAANAVAGRLRSCAAAEQSLAIGQFNPFCSELTEGVRHEVKKYKNLVS